jgi:hypothetical protein
VQKFQLKQTVTGFGNSPNQEKQNAVINFSIIKQSVTDAFLGLETDITVFREG